MKTYQLTLLLKVPDDSLTTVDDVLAAVQADPVILMDGEVHDIKELS